MTYLYTLLYPVSLALLWFVGLFSKKVRGGLLGRRGVQKRLESASLSWPKSHSRYWIHFASSGELEQAIPLLEKIKEKEPESKIAITYFSPSGEKGVWLETRRRSERGATVPWDFADYLPWDTEKAVSCFIQTLRPQIFIGINRELWPILVLTLSKFKIPMALVACSLSKKARERFFLYRKGFSSLNWVGTIDDSTARFLRSEIPGLAVFTGGDTRCERVLTRKKSQTALSWASFFEKRKTFILASVWDEDFRALKTDLASLAKSHPFRVILVPHEPTVTAVKEIQNWAASHGLTFRLWSQFLRMPDDESHLIMDQVGHLAELYRVATVVFVGGSFKKRVHNILEPAAYGCPILTGPWMENSLEATEMKALGILFTSSDGREIIKRAEVLLTNTEEQMKVSKLTEKYLLDRQGASSFYTEQIFNLRSFPQPE